MFLVLDFLRTVPEVRCYRPSLRVIVPQTGEPHGPKLADLASGAAGLRSQARPALVAGDDLLTLASAGATHR